jgi:hypothetical protein
MAYTDEGLQAWKTIKQSLPFRQYIMLNSAPIQSLGKLLLKREIVSQLRERHGYDFRETRLIEELRERTGDPQPARYGRGRIPVFRVEGIAGLEVGEDVVDC